MSTTRSTTQREAIWGVLDAAVGPLLPEEILTVARRRCRSLGLATVYRALQRLEDEGRAARVTSGNGRVRFEVARGHHHHFECRDCERVYDVPGCLRSPRSLERTLPAGFRLEAHDVRMQGVCADCA
jgi:Fur family transcriptional regulator, ferric uptake regulator